MTYTWNGWATWNGVPTRVIEPVPGVKLRVLDNDDVAEAFTLLVQKYHARVDDVTKPHPADDWGFAFRVNVNSPSSLSRHAFGLAIDLDATEHPNKVAIAKTFTSAQISEIHKILDELKGIFRWGGDYVHTVDGMHFEINVSPQELRTLLIAAKSSVPSTKTVPQLADEVIQGLWGNGEERKVRLARAGYNYDLIQAEVSRKLGAAVQPPPKKTITQLVQEVLDGHWGNGVVRKQRLTKAGYNYDAVQAAVTRKLSTKKSIAQIASEVIAGEWGNGAVRKSKLQAAGYNYEAVRAEVNRRL